MNEHKKHGGAPIDTAHIHNVHYLITHWLVRCPCGFFGWIEKERW